MVGLRLRDSGIEFPGQTGLRNSITDVAGVRVGHSTIISGEPEAADGAVVRTGVTVVVPSDDPPWLRPLFASHHVLNGNGEMTGLHWVSESGLLTSYIGLTNTASVGVVRDALVSHEIDSRGPAGHYWSLPVVAETYDGVLNDIGGMHVESAHVFEAIRRASVLVEEGSVGGGTGMVCHGFKGGIGTSSRVLDTAGDRYTVGVLVQANHGARKRLRILGHPIGEIINDERVQIPRMGQPGGNDGSGSIIAVVATDAPLLPHQLKGLAQRVSLGIGRTGGLGEYTSGDIFFAFSTANRSLTPVGVGTTPAGVLKLEMLSQSALSPLYEAVVEATEEAIVNSMTSSTTMVGKGGVVVQGIPGDLLLELLGGAGSGPRSQVY